MRLKKYRLDIIVVALLLLVSISLLIVTLTKKEQGNFVSVEIDGEVIAEYPLSQNGVFSLNGGTNTLVIEDGAAYVSYSNCPDHTCERTGKIRYVGQTIICLPNRITIAVRGDQTEGGVDLIS